jgi:nucleotide-binding universal stress UspA family protein
MDDADVTPGADLPPPPAPPPPGAPPAPAAAPARAAAAPPPARRHVLIPVDDSPDAAAAARWAAAELFRPGDLFHLLHVAAEPAAARPWAFGVWVPPDADELELEAVEDAKALARRRFAGPLIDAGVPFELHVALAAAAEPAEVAAVVAREADALGAAAVVMARHTRAPFLGALLGSATAEVVKRVHSARCAVVILPPAQE